MQYIAEYCSTVELSGQSKYASTNNTETKTSLLRDKIHIFNITQPYYKHVFSSFNSSL